jgi:hypothetical protein
VAAAGKATGPSRMEQSGNVGGALLQLVRSDSATYSRTSCRSYREAGAEAAIRPLGLATMGVIGTRPTRRQGLGVGRESRWPSLDGPA